MAWLAPPAHRNRQRRAVRQRPMIECLRSDYDPFRTFETRSAFDRRAGPSAVADETHPSALLDCRRLGLACLSQEDSNLQDQATEGVAWTSVSLYALLRFRLTSLTGSPSCCGSWGSRKRCQRPRVYRRRATAATSEAVASGDLVLVTVRLVSGSGRAAVERGASFFEQTRADWEKGRCVPKPLRRSTLVHSVPRPASSHYELWGEEKIRQVAVAVEARQRQFAKVRFILNLLPDLAPGWRTRRGLLG